MANTTIQLKFSNTTAVPTSLNVAEPAYSYTSNTLFIGSPAGTGSIAIGGKFYLDQQQIIFDRGNSAFAGANSAGSYANAAFAAANTAAASTGAYAQANAAFNTANAAFTVANNAFTSANGAIVFNTANAAFLAANAATATDATQNNSITAAFNTANAAFTAANAATATDTTQNNSIAAAFTRANNSLNANTGGTITGTVFVTGDLDVTGNLVITGNTITQDVTTLNIADPLIYLAANNYSSDVVEIGFAANYYDGATQRHTGLFREASNKEFYVFDNYDKEPDANLIDINDASFRVATLNANVKSSLITLKGVDLLQYVNNAYAAANTADAKGTSAGSYANSAFAVANNSIGTNLTQNASITAAFTAANSAGVYANSAFAAANNTAGVNTTQNNSITAAFAHANASFLVANGAAFVANTDFTGLSITAANYGTASTVASFRVEANGRISSANNTSIAIDAAAITSGTLGVPRGGTGAATFTNNGVLLGQGTSAFATASSSTEGHVLTINASGVPTFSHLQGGTF